MAFILIINLFICFETLQNDTHLLFCPISIYVISIVYDYQVFNQKFYSIKKSIVHYSKFDIFFT